MKRRWLRFSLLTTVVAMLTGAGLGWINLRWQKITAVTKTTKKGLESSFDGMPLAFTISLGWPFPCYEYKEVIPGPYSFETEVRSISNAEYGKLYDRFPSMFSSSENWIYVNIIPNVIIGLVLILAEMVLLEWWLNKRRMRQTKHG